MDDKNEKHSFEHKISFGVQKDNTKCQVAQGINRSGNVAVSLSSAYGRATYMHSANTPVSPGMIRSSTFMRFFPRKDPVFSDDL